LTLPFCNLIQVVVVVVAVPESSSSAEIEAVTEPNTPPKAWAGAASAVLLVDPKKQLELPIGIPSGARGAALPNSNPLLVEVVVEGFRAEASTVEVVDPNPSSRPLVVVEPKPLKPEERSEPSSKPTDGAGGARAAPKGEEEVAELPKPTLVEWKAEGAGSRGEVLEVGHPKPNSLEPEGAFAGAPPLNDSSCRLLPCLAVPLCLAMFVSRSQI
jgi:hypothetical protein